MGVVELQVVVQGLSAILDDAIIDGLCEMLSLFDHCLILRSYAPC